MAPGWRPEAAKERFKTRQNCYGPGLPGGPNFTAEFQIRCQSDGSMPKSLMAGRRCGPGTKRPYPAPEIVAIKIRGPLQENQI